MQETQVRSLGQEDPLKEETATHSSILAWETPQTEEVGYSPQNRKELKTTERPSMHTKEQEEGVLWVSLARCAWETSQRN